MKLSELKEGQKAIIVKIYGRGTFRKRLSEMGFVRGKEITVIKYAPLKDPIEYNIMGYEVSLRRSEAELIEVTTKEEIAKEISIKTNEALILDEENWKTKALEKSKVINIALVGNPNCGKTTLFNFATGSSEHTGNYGGVTVDSKKGVLHYKDYKIIVTDLPGTYSLSAYSPEELFVRKHIIEEMPDLIVNVIDSSNLERNLYLTTQLIDIDTKIVIALNMFDEMQKRGDKLNIEMLSNLLGSPIIPTIAPKGVGINELLQKIVDVYEDKAPCSRHIHINYGKELENGIKAIQKKIRIPENKWLTNKVSSRFLAIKLLEKDSDAEKTISKCRNAEAIKREAKKQIQKLETYLKDDTETLFSDARYGFIQGALKETYEPGKIDTHKKTKIIDNIITHKIWGYPVFLLFLYIMFASTFKLGEYPMQWIDWIVQKTAFLFDRFMADGMLKDMIIDGIINGVGAVIVFLPNILILFFFISIMEDTGYMARVAFLMDKLMHKIGLHGKSFIPLLMGFGCNVPAVMATRTIENRRDRLLTMLINPFMSCSARLPIYLVVIGAIFPKYKSLLLFGIYLTGIIVAIVVAKIFNKTIFKNKEAPFVMELPPYRLPTMRALNKHMWNKTKSYLKKMGGIILIASIIIWALGYFPLHKDINAKYQNKIDSLNTEYLAKLNSATIDTTKLKNSYEQKLQQLEIDKQSEHQAKSFIGILGKFFEPVMRPLGFDWRMTVAVISGTPAKEIVVSTLGVLYKTGDNDNNLMQALQKARYETGKRKGELIFRWNTALAFLAFVLLYFPCIATITAIKNESGSWKWAIFAMTYTTILAWFAAFLIFQFGNFIHL